MPDTTSTLDLAEARAILGRTPAVLRALLEDLPDVWLDTRESATAWSPKEVLAHLIFGERTDWIPRVRIILERGEAQPFDAVDRQGHQELSKEPLTTLLDSFQDLRGSNLRALQDMLMEPSDFLLCGTHPQLGPVTLAQLLATWTAHDLNHIDQIVRTMAARYRDEVGPFDHPDYLGILHRVKPGS